MIVREDLYAKTCEFMADHLFPDEPACKSISLTWNQELADVMMTVIKENISIALVSSTTDKIIGLRLIGIEKKDDVFEPNECKLESMKRFLHFINYLASLFDLFNHFDVDEVFTLFGLSVHIDHRHKGLGHKLMQAALIFIKSLNVGPVVVKGDCSSSFSRRIYEKTGFELLREVPYTEYKIDGEIAIKNTGQHNYMTRFAKTV